jgi:CDGSH-type Zn-finger protein
MSETFQPVVIKLHDNGSLRVKRPATVVDPDGIRYEITRKTFFLCRCSASRNKPFCDGSHARVGFEARDRVALDHTEDEAAA